MQACSRSYLFNLLDKAAGITEANRQRATDVEQKLTYQAHRQLLDEAIAATFDRMERVDPVCAEEVMSLIIRRHRGAKRAFRDILARAKARVLPVAAAAGSIT